MGICCVKDNNIISTQINPKDKKEKLRSTRSSIYQINKENIYDVYDLCGKISSGYYGKLEKACFKGDPSKFYAVKIISKANLSKKNLTNLICEIQVLAKLDHPNIVKYYETKNNEKNFNLVMELCEGGELFERIVKKKRLQEKDAAEILFKITHAISHCHSRNIVHRDLKAENILFETKSDNKNDVKIIDFGLARKKEKHNMHSIVGTPCYVAPEVLEGTYDYKCDIWALGILTYVMLFGKYPFDDQNKSVLFDKIKNAEPKYNTSLISNEALNLIQSLLKKDPKKRPDASSILDHPWFAKMIKDKFKDNVNDLNVISTLKTFKTPNAFLKKILTFIVKDAQGNNEIDEIKRKFYILDDNKNGVVEISKYQSHIDPISINSIVKKQEDNNYNESHELFGDCILNKFVKNDIPTNANSQVGSKMDYTSYLAANLREKKLITEESIRSLFSRFDVEKQGFINVNSFHKALRRTGKQISEDECEVMLKDAGFKNPNLIEYDEFLKIVGDFLC